MVFSQNIHQRSVGIIHIMLKYCTNENALKITTANSAQVIHPQNLRTSRLMAHDIEVMKLCVSFYFEDIRGAQNELERVSERLLKLDEVVRGIDYSHKLGVDVSCSNTECDKLIERVEALKIYIDVCAQVCDKVKNAKLLISTVDGGWLLWAHYVDGVRWNVLALRERVDVRTIRRWKTKAIQELYCLMPEEYRRYTIPNAQIL